MHRNLHVLTHSFPTRRSSDLGLRLYPADDHRVGGGAVCAVAGTGVPDRARVRGRAGGGVPVGVDMRQLPLSAAIVAVVLFAAAVAGFGAALDGYSPAIPPVGLLGPPGVPDALACHGPGLGEWK